MTDLSLAVERVLWLNGRFANEGEALISPLDRGFLYGDGVFETMRVEKGFVLYLEDHLERLQRSLASLRIALASPPDWETVFEELLRRNGLAESQTAAAKIVVTRGVIPGLGLPSQERPTICVTVQPYAPPSAAAYEKGWSVRVFREGFSPPTARHKSLNYLYFLMARQAALDEGADEALIADPEGRIVEAAAGSLLVRAGGRWFRPAGRFQLPGTTIGQAVKLLQEAGYEVEEQSFTVEELLSAQTVWVLNSLMGVIPVSQVNGLPMPEPAAEEASRLRTALFQRGGRRQGLADFI